MTTSEFEPNRRVLVVDDNEQIHEDFARVFSSKPDDARELAAMEAALFGDSTPAVAEIKFDIAYASQGHEALGKLEAALERNEPFALAFVDMRMPPGWDGLETISRLWKADADLQVVICTAYSDHTWDDIIDRVGATDKLLILKKPFDPIEVRQLASALTQKWGLSQQARLKTSEMNDLVKARTTELAAARDELISINTQLEKARKAAEAASHSKSAFLANMSHEIRTPMTAIMGYTDLLREALQPSPGLEDHLGAVDAIHRNGAHLLGIINDILDISKIEAGCVDLEIMACSIRELVRDVAELLSDGARGRGLSLEIELVEPLPEVCYTDPTRLRQILINLVGNAIKFSTQGCIRIVIRSIQENNQSLISFEIVDPGVGLTAEQIARLFKRFKQSDASTTRKHGGTGLGLVISKQLAVLLGGDITVQSTPGTGSRFTATISAQPAENATGKATAPMYDATLPNKPLAGLRVLVAEDGEDNQRLISHFLMRAGASLVVVENGRLAVEKAMEADAGEQPFDVILMDMQMPIMDGYTATTELRSRHTTIPIIALTAHALSGEKRHCIEAGCDEYLTKPIDWKQLFMTIRGLVQARQQPQPVRT